MSEFKIRINPEVSVNFQDGKFFIKDPRGAEMVKQFCRKYEGKEGTFILRPYKRKKTNEQNKYYRGVVVQILSLEWGLTNKECHQYLSSEHLAYFKNGFKLVKSTSLDDWNSLDWENYMSFLRSWASADHSIWIPAPNEVDQVSLPDNYY